MSSKKLAIWAAKQAKKSQQSFKAVEEANANNIVPKPTSQKSLKLQRESERRLSRKTVELNTGPVKSSPIGWFHPSRAPYRWMILLLTSFFLLSSYMSDESIGATVPLLKSELNLTSKQVGMLYSASFVPCIIMTFLGGFLIDKYGTNKISMLYSTFVLFGTAIFALSPNYYGKLAGRIIFGIGLEPLEVCQDAILSRWFSDDGVRVGSPTLAFSYGFTFAVSQAGELLGANSLPTLAQYGLFYAYIFCTGACVLGWICNLVLVYFDWKAQSVIQLNDDEEEDEAFSFKALKQFPIQYWILGFITMLSYSSMLIFFTFSTDIMYKKYGYTPKKAGHLMSFVYGLSILFSPFIGWLINKYGMICWLMSLGGLLYSGSAFFMAFTNFTFTPIVSLVAAGIAYSLVPNAIWPAVSLATDDENAGTAFGIVTGMNSIMLLGCPYLIGFLHDHYGNYQYALMTFGGLGGLGFLLSLALYFIDRAKGSLLHIHEPKEEDKEKQPLLVNPGSGSLKK